MRLSKLAAVLGLTVLGLSSPRAEAALFTLNQLLVPGTQVQESDKIFSNFSFTSVAFGGASPVSPSLVTVNFTSGPSFVQLDFSSAAFFAAPGQAQSTVLQYDVQVVSGSDRIVGNDLALLAGAVGPGGGVAISELITTPSGGFLGDKLVFITDSSSALTDTAAFGPQVAIRVQKDIGLIGPAFLTNFSQRILQQQAPTPIPTPVPEPATLALVSLGAVVLGASAWRRKRAKPKPW